jgi:ubiquinol-cytochrome c reductase cytochrome b subunit
MTWITGAVAFLASIGTAFTGYLVQTNFDSQWISFEAKDGLNAVGIGAFFNVTNLGQMLLLHACLLPLVVGVIVVWHVLLVRRRGVVPPIDAVENAATPIDAVENAATPIDAVENAATPRDSASSTQDQGTGVRP